MILRSPRERVLQTLCFEAGGLLMVAPAYMLLFGTSAAEGFGVLFAVSLAVMLWSPCYNTMFDWADFTLTGRLASDRPHRLRLIHAALHELSSIIVSLPVLMGMGDLSFGTALALDLGLTLFFGVYAYVFHLAYDRWRPMEAGLQV